MDTAFFIFDMLNYMLWYGYLNSCLKKRFSNKLSYLLEALIILLSYTATSMVQKLSTQNSLVFFGINMLACIFLFKDHWSKVLFTFFTLIVTVMISELLCVISFIPREILYTPANLPFNIHWVLSLCLYIIVEFTFLTLLGLLFRRQYFNLTASEYMLFALFPFSQILLILGIVYTFGKYRLEVEIPYFLLTVLICAVADLGLFIAIMHISQRKMLINENQKLAALMDRQDKHYTELTQHYEEMRRMRHDMENQLIAMKQLINRGDELEAGEYIEEILGSSALCRRAVCENPVLDGFLQDKFRTAEEKGIKLRAQLSCRSYSAIPNLDLVRAFGNILDNAIEASKELPGAEIEISAKEARGYLIISCSNPYLKSEAPKEARIPGLSRGIGNKVLEKLAQIHSGSFSYKAEDGIYSLKLIMKTEAGLNA